MPKTVKKKPKKALTFKFNKINIIYFFSVSFLSLLSIFLVNLLPAQRSWLGGKTSEVFVAVGDTDFPPEYFRKILFGETVTGEITEQDTPNPNSQSGFVDGFWFELPDFTSFNNLELFFRSCPQNGDNDNFNNCQPFSSFSEVIWVYDSDSNYLGAYNNRLDFANFPITNDRVYFILIGTDINSGEKTGYYKLTFDYKYRSTGFKVRFRGVNANKGNINMAVKIYRPWANVDKLLDLGIVSMRGYDNGDYIGSFELSGNSFDFDNNILLIKGPKHLQRRFNNISFLKDGVLDFSNRYLEPGDLPLPQDGIVNSYDLNYLWYQRGSRTVSDLNIGDLNYDGIINMGDVSLVLEAFKNPVDEGI